MHAALGRDACVQASGSGETQKIVCENYHFRCDSHHQNGLLKLMSCIDPDYTRTVLSRTLVSLRKSDLANTIAPATELHEIANSNAFVTSNLTA